MDSKPTLVRMVGINPDTDEAVLNWLIYDLSATVNEQFRVLSAEVE
jgi:hypothetical protein